VTARHCGSRRAFVLASLGAVLPASRRAAAQQDTAGQTPVAPLPQPGAAGLPRSRVTDYENDPFVVGVESQLRCTCGCNLSVYTCRTTDFTCQTSPAMHREVIALVEQGQTGQAILDAFVTRYGETVLMAPPRRGFNIAAYVVPGIAITAVGAGIVWVLARRARRLAPATLPVRDPEPPAGLSPDDAARLEAELEQLER
jgi:cytochrome c-type biogenesis protein CcmH